MDTSRFLLFSCTYDAPHKTGKKVLYGVLNEGLHGISC